MKVLGLDIRRNSRVDPPGGEYGLDGEQILQRFTHALTDDNPDLAGQAKFRIFDQMVHTDSIVKQVVWLPRLAVRGAHWEAKPASEDGVDRLIADALTWNFGLADQPGFTAQSWAQSCDQALLSLRYGAMFEEIIWGDPTDWAAGDGTLRTIRPVERLAPRTPTTIRSVDWSAGRITEVSQQLPGTKPIPGIKLCYYALEPEPGRWDGVSMLRAAYGPWWLKKELMVAAGIAWDRWAAGFPKIRYPANGGQKALEKAEELGRAVRNHEHAYAAFEGPPPDAANPNGWDIEIMGGNAVLPDPTPLLQRYDLAIYGAGLMQWMSLGTGSHSGARATAQVQDEPFYLALEAIAGDLAVERQRQVFRRFVDVNFGTEYKTPTLTVSKIQSEDVEKLGRILYDLSQAGFTMSYRELQDYVFTLAHLPGLPEGLKLPGEGDGIPPVADPPADEPPVL